MCICAFASLLLLRKGRLQPPSPVGWTRCWFVMKTMRATSLETLRCSDARDCLCLHVIHGMMLFSRTIPALVSPPVPASRHSGFGLFPPGTELSCLDVSIFVFHGTFAHPSAPVVLRERGDETHSYKYQARTKPPLQLGFSFFHPEASSAYPRSSKIALLRLQFLISFALTDHAPYSCQCS